MSNMDTTRLAVANGKFIIAVLNVQNLIDFDR